MILNVALHSFASTNLHLFGVFFDGLDAKINITLMCALLNMYIAVG